MTTANEKVLVLRDNDGNFYLLTEQAIQSARVPQEKMGEVQQALSGSDTSGFYFNTNLAFLNQQNFQSANNVVLGGFALVGSQTALNLASNSANIQQG
jgi:hypothetical protein